MASPNPVPRLRRSTLSEDVYEALKALVMESVLAPGDRVNIDALARDMSVSPTPIREALARLESDGLVRKRPLAGYTVTPLLSRQEFNDLVDIRLLLEGAAARWAAERANDEQRGQIEAAADAAVAPRDSGVDGWRSYAEFTVLDARFHDVVALAAANQLLHDSIARLHAHLHLVRLYFPYATAGTTPEEHRRIAEAIRRGQPDAAEAAMREHLTNARERHLPAFDRGA
jgi:DNA-binding GntR family transcriptional regulator